MSDDNENSKNNKTIDKDNTVSDGISSDDAIKEEEKSHTIAKDSDSNKSIKKDSSSEDKDSFIDTTTTLKSVMDDKNEDGYVVRGESKISDVLDAKGESVKEKKAAEILANRGVDSKANEEITLVDSRGNEIIKDEDVESKEDTLEASNVLDVTKIIRQDVIDFSEGHFLKPDGVLDKSKKEKAEEDAESQEQEKQVTEKLEIQHKRDELVEKLAINSETYTDQVYNVYTESTSDAGISEITTKKEKEKDFSELFEELVDVLIDREKFFASLSDEEAEEIAGGKIPKVETVIKVLENALDEAGFPEIDGMEGGFMDYIRNHKGKLLSAASTVGLASSAYLGLDYGMDAAAELSKDNFDELDVAGKAINAVGYTTLLPAKKAVDIFWGHENDKETSDNEVVQRYLDEKEEFSKKFPDKMEKVNEYLHENATQTSLGLMTATEIVTAVGHGLKAASGSIGDGVVAGARVLAAGALTGISIAKYIKEDRENPDYDPKLPNEKIVSGLGNLLADKYKENQEKADSALTGMGTILLSAPSVILSISSAIEGDMTKAAAAAGLAFNYGVYMAVNAMDDPEIDIMSAKDTNLLTDIYYEAAKDSLNILVDNYQVAKGFAGKDMHLINETLDEITKEKEILTNQSPAGTEIIHVDPKENLENITNAVQTIANSVAARQFTKKTSPEIAHRIAKRLDEDFKTNIAEEFIPVKDLKDSKFLDHNDPVHAYARALKADAMDILDDGRVMVVYSHPKKLPDEVRSNWLSLKELREGESLPFLSKSAKSKKLPDLVHKSNMDQVGFVMSKQDLRLLVALSTDLIGNRELFEREADKGEVKKLMRDFTSVSERKEQKYNSDKSKEVNNSFGDILDVMEDIVRKNDPLYPKTVKRLDKAFDIIKSSSNDEEIMSELAKMLRAKGIDRAEDKDSVILIYDNPNDVPNRVITAIDEISELKGEFRKEGVEQKVALIMPEKEMALLALMVKSKQSSKKLSEDGFKVLAKMLNDNIDNAIKGAIKGEDQSKGV